MKEKAVCLSVDNFLVPESFVLAYASGHDVPLNLQQNKCAFLFVLCVFCILVEVLLHLHPDPAIRDYVPDPSFQACLLLIIFFFNIYYLFGFAGLGLCCSMQTLSCGMWDLVP